MLIWSNRKFENIIIFLLLWKIISITVSSDLFELNEEFLKLLSADVIVYYCLCESLRRTGLLLQDPNMGRLYIDLTNVIVFLLVFILF